MPVKPPPPNRVLEARLADFGRDGYARAAEALFAAQERSAGSPIAPGARRRAGLKVYSDSGAGLRTPPDLVRGVIEALERRGFPRDRMFLVGLDAMRLRACGFLPPLSVGGDRFEGVPVLVLGSGAFYEPGWFYDSPLPSKLDSAIASDAASAESERAVLAVTEEDRKSYLPMPLLFEADLWINLPACTDHPVVGVNGALVNATLWNASNTQRFFRSPATAPAAVAEMAAIPELRAGWAFTIVSLQRYQFIGGPVFNSLYTLSEPVVWLSENPVAIDALLAERINRGRREAGFHGLQDELRFIGFAEQLGLGSGDPSGIEWVRLSEGRGPDAEAGGATAPRAGS